MIVHLEVLSVIVNDQLCFLRAMNYYTFGLCCSTATRVLVEAATPNMARLPNQTVTQRALGARDSSVEGHWPTLSTPPSVRLHVHPHQI